MIRVDAHQHFWQYHPVRDSWITEDMSVIRRDFMPEDLEPLLAANGLDGCVLVQTDQSDDHTDWLLTLAEKHDFIKAVVGWTDLQSPDVKEKLSAYKKHKKLKGFRHILQGEQQRSFMLRHEFKNGIRQLANFGFTYDILIYPDQLRYTELLVKEYPDQPFVIDHLAKPYIRSNKIDEWRKEINAVARYPNVSCKLSGMVTEADWKTWTKESFRPYLDVVVNAFGVDRLLFGSDWPVCLVAASYADVVGIIRDYFSAFSEQEQAKVFGSNAVNFYNINN
ncbi:MAG TPA: amidohydrolase family protein [Chitinophagaceae bacterium]|nr:amidohydrolase family protein [Chitinophagaceae bacterium]